MDKTSRGYILSGGAWMRSYGLQPQNIAAGAPIGRHQHNGILPGGHDAHLWGFPLGGLPTFRDQKQIPWEGYN
jgi:hypothetical protein